MKCGSCRISNASSYTKITDGHKLFEILKKLNPTRTYNEKQSYFCGFCLEISTKKLSDTESLSDLTDQNANSLSARNPSFTNTMSIDAHDLLVARQIVTSDVGSPQINRTIRHVRIGAEFMNASPVSRKIHSKRKATSESIPLKAKPCPKRFKTQLKRTSDNVTLSIPENDNPESTIGKEVFSPNSEPISENAILLDIQLENDDAASSASSSEIASNRNSAESSISVEAVIRSNSNLSSSSLSHKVVNVPIDIEQGVEARNQIVYSQNPIIESASNQPLSTMQPAVAGPSAPVAKKPRTRQEYVHVQRDILRRYFNENQHEVNVNNYSRTTAG